MPMAPDAPLSPLRTLARDDAPAIAYHKLDGKGPGVVFLGGFMSDMTGSKALALEEHCRKTGRAFLRFDYRGHGESEGRFEDGTIGLWAEDALAAFDDLTKGPQVLVGSSMGGWIMLLTALARPERIAGLLGIAAAPDFTEDLMWEAFDESIREQILREGLYHQPSEYDDSPYPITRALIEDGREHLLLRNRIPLTCPVRLLQGVEDLDVPWRTATRISEQLQSEDVEITLVKAGDHRLSEPQDLQRLCATLDRLIETLVG